MKKIATGFAAIIMAVAAFAFTKPSNVKFADPYWFTTDDNGNVNNSMGVPPQQSSDPFGCSGTVKGCSKAYTSYVLISPGVYGPSGTLTITHKKP
ncbi:hypothetical protein FRZ67_11645 [Panacibacter ginsenosidivorans]|uniref:Secreted protein n=1 Tax=Panacibacter ginsenosidivorans TaxID=1813871 RepID=A0A5B8VAM2_9BACT|nr:hypothetical protein [Panacibacter ginsenosidivorans]QEC67921.1 hypothetical protein FRZ67_11645 [Panacibacter ginsenosidivorans]